MIPEGESSKGRLKELCGAKMIAPLDSYLGVGGLPFKITPQAMVKIAYWAQNQGSFQRAEGAIPEIMNVYVNKETIRAVANYVGGVVFGNDCQDAEKVYSMVNACKVDFPKDKRGVLYIQTDGAALNTRTKDERDSSWRENKLGEVFSSYNIRYWTDRKGERQHRITKKEYVSYVGSITEFKKHLLACALRNGYGRFRETVILSDGATWIRNMVEEMFPDAQQILDFYHLCENVYIFAKALFNMDESKYIPWAKTICAHLKASQHGHVLWELNPFRDNPPNGCSVNLHGYISNNIDNIDYATYLAKGYFIGSGAIESGNKLVLQDRLKRAGMRWNVPSAQTILSLRAKAESNLWLSHVEIPFLVYCSSRPIFV